MSPQLVKVIGGGLAGCEAALQLASAGVPVDLYEMRPETSTPAHKTGGLAELVCSNSFKGLSLDSAHGLFKEELRRMGSQLISVAHSCRVPAGQSLAVDREQFSSRVEQMVLNQPLITLRRQEASSLDPDTYTIIATGPLTSDNLCRPLYKALGHEGLFFFDCISPVVETDSIDRRHSYAKNRWEKGDTEDFINCPLNREQYHEFVKALKQADTVEEKPFEKKELFEGCLPIEEMASRGEDTLRFGPLRPIGLSNPDTRDKPHAVIQLRAENTQRTLYNLVGCQTRLKQSTQKKVFSLVPALSRAVFARYGSMHRNTFINAPEALQAGLRLKGTRLYFAGQITGAEGYTEAIGTGLYSAAVVYAAMKGNPGFNWPRGSCLRALTDHLTSPNPGFQPMNLNFGLFPRPEKIRKREKKAYIMEQCFGALDGFKLPWQ
ncbi:methylenetetrahydrofolate--tRNA-(uracil(54)-C(5))-methyltransferase (FADH(2)-oxidizing) TrmFO [Fibrobacterota bacterium]